MRMLTRVFIILTLLIGLAAACKVANADMKKIDDLRHFYANHGLDFFGELISGDEDALGDERRHAKLELLADDARTRALTQLEGLMRTAQGPMRAELLMRKATLLADRARTATYFQNNPFKTSRVAKDPRTYLRESIATFQRIEREFAGHPKMDVILFSIAYDYGEMREANQAFHYYQLLVSRFPASPLVGDARLALAEIDFDRRDFKAAVVELKQIIAAEHPRLKNFALYKLAWTYYNMKDLASSTLALEKVVDGVNNASGVQRARLELRKEALHDLVAFYADRPESDAPEQAQAYFAKIARTPDAIVAEYAQARAKRLASLAANKATVPDEETDDFQLSEPDELLFRLAQLYRDQGKHQNGAVVAAALLDRLPRHPRSVALYRLRAEAAEKLRRRDQVVAELERLTTAIEHDLPPVGSGELATASYGAITEALEKDSKTKVELATAAPLPDLKSQTPYQRQLAKVGYETLNDFSSFLHGEYSKTQEQGTARQALAAYDLGVRGTLEPWRGQPLEPLFALRRRRAQLLFSLKSWDRAARDFQWLALHATAATPVLTADIQGEIGALEAWLKETPVKVEASKDGKTPLNPVHERMLNAYDRDLALHLTQPAERERSAGILVMSARLYREYVRDDETLRRLAYYARKFSDQKEAVPATRDILALLNGGARWEELRDITGELLKSSSYAKGPIASELRKSNEYSSLRLLEKLEADKDWDKATARFSEFAKEHPDSSFASQALIKAASAALESNKLSKDPEKAVAKLEAAAEAPDTAIQLQALLGLEPFYRQAFQWGRLRALYEKMLALKPDPKTAAATRTNLEAIKALDGKSFSGAGEELVQGDPDLPRLLAQFDRFENESREYRALRFNKSNNNPAKNFKKKTELETALQARADALAGEAPKSLRGAAETWAATVKSELVLELAETIETAAAPAALKGAQDADRKAYREAIDAQARDLHEAARKLGDTALKLATQTESPFALDERLTALLDRLGDHTRVAHADFRPIWTRRPGPRDSGKAPSDELIRELGFKLLRADGRDDIRAVEAKLMQAYFLRGEAGYAYAVATAIGGGSDDPALTAAAVKFAIDSVRLPSRLRKALAENVLGARERWDLARWLAGRRAELGPEQKAWFDEALAALLHEGTGAPAAPEHAAND